MLVESCDFISSSVCVQSLSSGINQQSHCIYVLFLECYWSFLLMILMQNDMYQAEVEILEWVGGIHPISLAWSESVQNNWICCKFYACIGILAIFSMFAPLHPPHENWIPTTAAGNASRELADSNGITKCFCWNLVSLPFQKMWELQSSKDFTFYCSAFKNTSPVQRGHSWKWSLWRVECIKHLSQ